MRTILSSLIVLLAFSGSAQVGVRWDQVRSPASVSNLVFLNVKDFGAKGNGTTDDTLAISNAVRAASLSNIGATRAAALSNQTEVWFPAGQYKTTAPIKITAPGTRLRGVGGLGQCVISNTVSTIFWLTNSVGANSPNDIIIDGFEFQTIGFTNDAIVACPSQDTMDGVTIMNCRAYYFRHCLLMDSVSNSRILNNDFTFSQFGIRQTNIASSHICNGNYIGQSTMTGNSIASICIDGGTQWTIDLADTGGTTGSFTNSVTGTSMTTTNIILITGSASATFRGGNSEDTAPEMGLGFSGIKTIGSGGYNLSFNHVSIGNFSTNALSMWSLELADSGSFSSFVSLDNCAFGAVTNLNGFPSVKITHSESQSVIAIGTKVMAAFYTNAVLHTNCLLSVYPTVDVDTTGTITGLGASYNGYIQVMLTNGSPVLMQRTPMGWRQLDAQNSGSLTSPNTWSGSQTWNAGNLFVGTNRWQAGLQVMNFGNSYGAPLWLFGGSGAAGDGVVLRMTPEQVIGADSVAGWDGLDFEHLAGPYVNGYETRLNLKLNSGSSPTSMTNVLSLFPDGAVSAGTSNRPALLQAKGINTAGNLVVGATTNQVAYGATNNAPTTPLTVNSWISVQVQGDTTVYRMPLYK